jgi:AraC-like DNA-binding protein
MEIVVECSMSYIDTKDIGVFDIRAGESDEMIQRGNATQVSGLLLGICDRGTCSYLLSQSRHDVGRNGVFFALPGQLFSVQEYSGDLEATVVFVTSEYLLKMGSQSGILLLQGNEPVRGKLFDSLSKLDGVVPQDIVLTDEIAEDVRHILSVLRRHAYPQSDKSNLLMSVPLIQALLLLVLESQPHDGMKVRSLSSHEQLTKDFFVLLLQHHKEEHDVSYYAERLFVTPKYLSTVVSKTTGSPIQDWISRLLLFTAKQLLKNSRLSVQQISSELHFSTPSSFIRFFRRMTGLTPREYRL